MHQVSFRDAYFAARQIRKNTRELGCPSIRKALIFGRNLNRHMDRVDKIIDEYIKALVEEDGVGGGAAAGPTARIRAARGQQSIRGGLTRILAGTLADFTRTIMRVRTAFPIIARQILSKNEVWIDSTLLLRDARSNRPLRSSLQLNEFKFTTCFKRCRSFRCAPGRFTSKRAWYSCDTGSKTRFNPGGSVTCQIHEYVYSH